MERFKICTWNIGSSYKNNTFSDVVIELKKINPDVLCIQEMMDEEGYISTIQKKLRLNLLEYRRLSPSPYWPEKFMGIALFSNLEKRNIDFLHIPAPKLCYEYDKKMEFMHDKGFIFCEFKDFSLVTGHFFPFYRYNLNDYDFKKYYDFLDNWIDEKIKCKNKIVVAADFNSNYSRNLLSKSLSKLDCAIDGITRPIHRGGDCIYFSHQFQLREAQNLFRKEDHHVCFAVFED